MKPDTIYALRPITKAAGEVTLAIVDFTQQLSSGETLTGSPTVTVSPVGPTLGTAAVNSSVLTPRDGGETIAIGAGVSFSISGGASKQRYEITVLCNTTRSGRVAAGKFLVLVDV